MSESRADGRQSSVLHIWSILGCFQIQQCAGYAKVHLRWPNLLKFAVFPSWKWHHWAFCPSSLGKRCSVSQAKTTPSFAVCVDENLYGSIVTQLSISSHAKAPCQELPCLHAQSDFKCQEYCVRCCSHFIDLLVLHRVGSSVEYQWTLGWGFLWAHGGGR